MFSAVRPVYAAYSPSCDVKWKPEHMRERVWYPVYGSETGTIKRADGSLGEAFFLHVIGEFGRPCRLIASNAVLCLDGQHTDQRFAACEGKPDAR